MNRLQVCCLSWFIVRFIFVQYAHGFISADPWSRTRSKFMPTPRACVSLHPVCMMNSLSDDHNERQLHHEKEITALVDSQDMTPKQRGDLLQFILRPNPTCSVDQMSGTDLAYIGDVVYELYIRARTIWPLKRTTDLQQQAVSLVRGEYSWLVLVLWPVESIVSDQLFFKTICGKCTA
jgi:hypothetical protein